MKKMWEYLKNDEELQQLRKEWKEKFKESFPPWNYDCFGGPDEYKRRIKAALEVNDSKNICETCSSKACTRFSNVTSFSTKDRNVNS